MAAEGRDECSLGDSNDKECSPPKSIRRKSKQKNKRKITDSSDDDDTKQDYDLSNNRNKPLQRRRKKQISEITPKRTTNIATNAVNNKKRNRNEFEHAFEDEAEPYDFPTIDEIAENIQLYETEMVEMTDTVAIGKEYKQLTQTHNNNAVGCQEPECNSVTICPMYLKHFGINVCRECKWKGKYKCITKTNAKKQYLLSEGDINSLKCWIKSINQNRNMNNNSNRWVPKYLKLYLIYQLQQLSVEKFGSTEAIEAERKKREVNKMQRSINNARKKRKLQVECLDDIEIDKKVVQQHEANIHVHTFGAAECVNQDTDEWSKACSECGYVESWEEF